MKKFSHIIQWIAAITLVIAHNLFRRTGFGQYSVPLQFCVVAPEAEESLDKQILRSLGGLNDRLKQLDEIDKAVKKNAADYDQVIGITSAVKLELDNFRRQQIELKSSMRTRVRSDGSPAEVSDGCARHLGALVVLAGLRQGNIAGSVKDAAEGIIKNVLGIETKTALSSSDIPLPTQYAGEVAELVYQYGQARRFGTVFPLGSGVVKLPRLKTDTVFGLLTQSAGVTEVSPATEWVTFTVEKFGGMVRLPTEMDEDSIVAIGQFVARYGARQIAQCEDYQFFRSTGAGSGQNGTAKGLTSSCAAAGDNKLYSQAGSSSGTKTHQSDMTLADLRALRAIPNGAALARAAYYMHPTYEANLVAFNTSATVTPFLRNAVGGEPTLDGFPVRWVPVMPAMSAGVSASLAHVVFGDVSFNYLGIRGGVRFDTSREAAFTTDEILIRIMERMTIGKMAADCAAVLINDAT